MIRYPECYTRQHIHLTVESRNRCTFYGPLIAGKDDDPREDDLAAAGAATLAFATALTTTGPRAPAPSTPRSDRIPYRIGDEVLWKRAGTQGHYVVRIVAVRPDSGRPYTIEVLQHEWWGATTASDTRRHVTAASLSAYGP